MSLYINVQIYFHNYMYILTYVYIPDQMKGATSMAGPVVWPSPAGKVVAAPPPLPNTCMEIVGELSSNPEPC